MTARQRLSDYGFKTKTINGDFQGVTGMKSASNEALALVNCDGKMLYYGDESTPYTPIGRSKAFASLIESGDITAPCFSWK